MGRCPVCGEQNAPGSRFCGHCGSPLAASCERCGAELPFGVRFCPACGAPIAEPLQSGEERKLVTVLFADVAGSTRLGERLDPERLKEVMGAYFDAMRREIEAEGGTVEKFIGDAVMAVFGVPAAHEDDPTRALRAAVRMKRGLERLNRELEPDHGVTLAMRVGVNTGEVIAATVPKPGEGMVTGDAVNVAARLEQNAESGQILVSERTARSARGLRLEEVGRLALKGKEEAVRAFQLLDPEPVGEPGGRVAPLDAFEAPARGAHHAPMVGREREIALLRSTYERVASERRPHLVTIYGEAGVGKTRLVEEFAEWAGGLAEMPLTVRGRCLPYGEGITYWPLAEILKDHSGVLDDDPPEVALGKVGEAAGKLLAEGGEDTDSERTAAALAFTVGMEDPAVPFLLAEQRPRESRVEAYDAWRLFFSALARRVPAVVVVEDIHWADAAMLDLLEDLAERALGPLLFLCPSRPELTARRPAWGGGRRNFSAIMLEPLPTAQAGRLLGLLLGEESVPGRVRAQILDRSGGNPFFLEEIVRHLLEERHRVEEEEGWLAASDIEGVEIPDTVQGVLAARMDLLGSTEKRVLQSAAVVGRAFWIGAVEKLLRGSGAGETDAARIGEALDRLEDRGLVVARLGSTMAGDREYMFRHILTRDVAYDSLPRRERAVAHAEVAAWIEERAGERQREFAELLAHHYAEAHRGIREDPRHDSLREEELRARAFQYTLLASEEARRKLVLPTAEVHAETALALAANPLERSHALEAMGRAYFHDSRGDLAWQCLKEAVDLRLQGGTTTQPDRDVARLCAAALEVATRGRGSMRSRLSRADAEPYLELGLTNAAEGDGEERCRLLVAKAFWPNSFRDGTRTEPESVEAREAGEEAAEMALRLGRPDLASAALDGVADSFVSDGLYGPLGEVVDRRLEIAGSLVDPYELADVHAAAAWRALHVGHYRDALRYADQGLQIALPASVVMALYCLDWRALAKFRLGDWEGFFADVAAAGELLGERRESPPGFAADHVGAAAFLHEVRGDEGAANRLLQVLDWLERAEERPSPTWAAFRALVLARRGEFDEALTELERADVPVSLYGRDRLLEARCDILGEQGDWDGASGAVAEARRHAERSGLEALPLYVARLDGRAALARGDVDGAIRALQASAAGFDRLEATWEAAVTSLDLARAQGNRGDAAEARRLLGAVVPVFDRLRSLRELLRAGELEGELV
jgi:class 3 adenylate cyclase/tetratricopeptide (TPR) repeat protein